MTAEVVNHPANLTDSELVDFYAVRVKAKLTEINAAQKYIEAGAELKACKEDLKRRSPHDHQNEGWMQAFHRPNRFGFSRPTAEMYIHIHDYFHSVTNGNTLNLPSSWRTLYEITLAFRDHHDRLLTLVNQGKITTLTTREAIIALAPRPGRPRGTTGTSTGARRNRTGGNGRQNNSEAAKAAALLILDQGRSYPSVRRETSLSDTVLRSAVAREEGRREVRLELEGAPPLSDEERRQRALENEDRIVAQRETERQERLAARSARQNALQTVAEPTQPWIMFGHQMWPILPGDFASYNRDQLFFASNYFFSWLELTQHRQEDRRSFAVELRTRLKFFRMFVERRLGSGDDKSEMTGFIQVFEKLCDLYRDNPDGNYDKPFDICILRDNY